MKVSIIEKFKLKKTLDVDPSLPGDFSSFLYKSFIDSEYVANQSSYRIPPTERKKSKPY